MKKKRIFLFCIFIIVLANITGCGKIKEVTDVARNNMVLESQLSQYSLDKKTYARISYGDKVYLITNEEVDFNQIDEAIGKVNYSCTLDENMREISKEELRKIDINGTKEDKRREHLTFGWVHKIKEINENDEIAININNLYYKCKIKK